MSEAINFIKAILVFTFLAGAAITHIPGVFFNLGAGQSKNKIKKLELKVEDLKEEKRQIKVRLERTEEERRRKEEELNRIEETVREQTGKIVTLKTEKEKLTDRISEQEKQLVAHQDSITILVASNRRVCEDNNHLLVRREDDTRRIAQLTWQVDTLAPKAARTERAERKVAVMRLLLLIVAVVHIMVFALKRLHLRPERTFPSVGFWREAGA